VGVNRPKYEKEGFCENVLKTRDVG
jgi:hypothetical protein